MKKLITMALVAACATFAGASELWWTIADDATYSGTGLSDWSVAKFYASADGKTVGGTQVGSNLSKEKIGELTYVATDISGYDSAAYSFYVELCNSEGNRLGSSYVSATQGAVAYTDVAGALYRGGMDTSTPTPYSFSQFTSAEVVPEPTSGLLLLIGFAGLALRRKRA